MRLLRLWRVAGQDFRLLITALRRPDRPQWLLPASLALGLFAFELLIPLVGIADDFVLLPLLLRALVNLAGQSIRKSDDRIVSANNQSVCHAITFGKVYEGMPSVAA
jgi:hypothetical protein